MNNFFEDISEYSKNDANIELDTFFAKIENLRDNKIVSRFVIEDIEDDSFLVLIKDMYANVPFHKMPWSYNNLDCWQAIAPSLKGKSFYGRVSQLDRHHDQPDLYRLYVNATVTKFRSIELHINNEYTGIVVLKTLYGVFIDIGCHFDWEYGSLLGLLHRSQILDTESNFEPGQTVVVKFLNETTRGITFGIEDYDYYVEKFLGKTVKTKIYKTDDSRLMSFKVEGRYKAKLLSISKINYGDNRKLIRKALHTFSDGDYIDCEVLQIKDKPFAMLVKWMPSEELISTILQANE